MMNRAILMRVVELAHSAAHNATIAAAYSDHNRTKAQEYARQTEDALYAALDALSEAGSSTPQSFFQVACEVTTPHEGIAA